MDKDEIISYLSENPKAIGILKLAVEEELKHLNDPYYLGWQWHEVKAYPQSINKLVIDGIVKISYNSRSYKHYRLVDLNVVREALEQLERDGIREDRLEVPSDLFSIILGYDDVKEIIKRGLTQDRPVHFLLIGPPATAKSLFLEEINRIPGSSYHTGSSTTKAGLTQFLLEVRPRILLIDELEKMKREDYAALLSLMESGKVVETKYGRRHEEYMKVWVVAACNKLNGVPPELISRFKPYIFHFREYSPDEYVQVAVKFLTEREGVNSELAEYIARRLSTLTSDVRAARGLGRICRSKEEVEKYLDVLKKYRAFDL